MIIDDLCRLYDLKLESGDVPPMGWSREKIGWEFVIDSEGNLISTIPQSDGSHPYVIMFVPEHTAKTSGDKAFFLCDSAAIFLGIGTEKDVREHKLSCESHKVFLSESDDPAAKAVCKFFAREHDNEPAAAACGASPDALAVFKLLGDEDLVHERAAIRGMWDSGSDSWSGSTSKKEAGKGAVSSRVVQCSVTGTLSKPATLFPLLKGVPHANSSGASLVSFNCDAFCSYGKTKDDQAANSAMSAMAAFKAGSALRYLMADKDHYITLGIDRLLFWTDEEAASELNDIALFLNMDDNGAANASNEDQTLLDELHERLAAIKNGLSHGSIDASTRYCLMCVSPNMARLSVRFFETGTLGDLNRRFGQYLRDIDMVDASKQNSYLAPRSIRTYINQTAPLGKADNVPETLVAPTLRAMLRGDAFPHSLYFRLIERMRADKGYNSRNGKKCEAMHLRVPMLKACLLRWARLQHDETTERSLTVALNEDNDNRGYVLGRLFAALEKAQRDALGQNINATIRDRYIGSAATTPARVFPQLLKLAQHHISKAEYGGFAERAIESIMSKIDSAEGFPATLSLSEQGQFYIGYYQQKAAFWTKKDAMKEEN